MLCRLMDGDKVQVHVGPSRTIYVVPKALLCESSSYFRSAFAGDFAEARTGNSELPQIQADTFEAIVKWMMTGFIEAPKVGRGGIRSFIDDRIELLPIVRIYLAAQFLNIDQLMETAVRAFEDATSAKRPIIPMSLTGQQYNSWYHHHTPLSSDPHELGVLEGKPGFSIDFVSLVLEEDQFGNMREIVKKCLVLAVVTGGEFIGTYGKIFERHPGFAMEILEEMQRAWSIHCYTSHPADGENPAARQCEMSRYHFDMLKERREKDSLRSIVELERAIEDEKDDDEDDDDP